jgi:hypothetical protein
VLTGAYDEGRRKIAMSECGMFFLLHCGCFYGRGRVQFSASLEFYDEEGRKKITMSECHTYSLSITCFCFVVGACGVGMSWGS